MCNCVGMSCAAADVCSIAKGVKLKVLWRLPQQWRAREQRARVEGRNE